MKATGPWQTLINKSNEGTDLAESTQNFTLLLMRMFFFCMTSYSGDVPCVSTLVIKKSCWKDGVKKGSSARERST